MSKCIINVDSKQTKSDLPKATHTGTLSIGDALIDCAVLSDGRRVITEKSMFKLLGRSRTGRIGGDQIPAFLAPKNLKCMISSDLMRGVEIISFARNKSQISYGYEATLIPEICRIFIQAEEMKILTPSQLPTASKCKIILHALAKVGITGLIDEATGYQWFRENDELQILFKKLLTEEHQAWLKKFPDDFFDNLKKMYGIATGKKNPSFFGHFINKYIYNEMAPEVLDELKKRNPTDENGIRKHRHHQFIVHSTGHPILDKQIQKVTVLMSVSDSIDGFVEIYEKTR